jgi:hypothetical protein
MAFPAICSEDVHSQLPTNRLQFSKTSKNISDIMLNVNVLQNTVLYVQNHFLKNHQKNCYCRLVVTVRKIVTY